MKKIYILLLFAFVCTYAQTQHLAGIEYFIDTDPGFGNGTKISFSGSKTEEKWTGNIPLNGVSLGFHYVGFRAIDDAGHWGQTNFRNFYLLPTVDPSLSGIEYFFDTNTSFGTGTFIAFNSHPKEDTLKAVIPMDGLTFGLHYLYTRAKTNSNQWGQTQKTAFYVVPTHVSGIKRSEYFIDTDPGYGNATSITLTEGANNLVIGLTGVANGYHRLSVRTQNNTGQWSIVSTISFMKLKQKIHPKLSGLSYAYYDYAANTYSSFTNYSINPAVQEIDDVLLLNNTANLVEGKKYAVVVYAYDENGTRSLMVSSDFIFHKTSLIGAVPIAINATAITSTGFTANWNAVTGASSYQLDVSADNFTTLVSGYNSKSVTGTMATITGLTSNTSYQYRVRATDGGYVTGNSNVIEVTTQACDVVAPVLYEATDVTGTSFRINWSTVPNAKYYRVFMNSDGSDVYTYIEKTSDTTYTYQSASLATTYYYFVLSESETCISPIQPNRLSVTTLNCNNPPKPTITMNGQNAETLILTSSASLGNQWYKNGTAIAGATNATYTVTDVGAYKVQVTVIGGCVSDFSNEVDIVVTGIEPTALNKVSLYPNPVENEFTISGLDKITNSKLFDATGKEYPIKFDSDDNGHHANVAYLASGLYLLRVQNDNSFKYIKFIKK